MTKTTGPQLAIQQRVTTSFAFPKNCHNVSVEHSSRDDGECGEAWPVQVLTAWDDRDDFKVLVLCDDAMIYDVRRIYDQEQ